MKKTTRYYADIYRNLLQKQYNPTDALIRLMEDNPYTVDEIFDTKND